MISLTSRINMELAEEYFSDHFSVDDYHREKETVAGQWVGRGAEFLGLKGEVQRKDYRAVLHQDLKRFGHEGKPRQSKIIYYDACFNMPKSVSMVSLVDARIKPLVLACVRNHFGRMEEWGQVRDRRGKKWHQEENRSTGNMVGALFLHESSRALDPELHVHAVIPNMSFDAERGEWLALQAGPLYERQKLHDLVVLNDVAKGLRGLGYEIEKTEAGFEIRGFDRAIIEKFSQRSQAITEKLKEWEKNPRELTKVAGRFKMRAKELTEADVRQLAALETRPPKRVVNGSDLRQDMLDRLTVTERETFERIVGAARKMASSSDPDISERQAMDHAVAHHFERASVATEADLLKAALRFGMGQLEFDQLREEVSDPRLIRDGDYFTTHEVLHEERRMIEFVRQGRGTRLMLGKADYSIENTQLSSEQVRAVRHILDSQDTVTAVRGAAGTGKTWMMREAIRGLEANGRSVFTFAPSAAASRGVLRQEGFPQADTLAQLLVNPQWEQKIAGQVIWLDEAGLVSARQMAALFDLAERTKARIILSGDVRQHGAVERGDALRLLEKYAGLSSVELLGIRRQQLEAYKKVVESLSAGQTGAAFAKLEAMGAIHEIPTGERYRKVAADYVGLISHRESALIVSPTHAEGESVTADVRARLKESRALRGEPRLFTSLRSFNWTTAERGELWRYQPGQVLVFVQNAVGFSKADQVTITARQPDGALEVRSGTGERKRVPLGLADRFQVYELRELEVCAGETVRISQNGLTADGKHKLNNSDLRKVRGFTPAGDLRLDNGWVVAKEFGHLQHGYVVTSHASQGKTVDHVLVAINARSAHASGSSEQAYVSISRGRYSVAIYTDDRAAVLEAAQASSARPSGHDLLAQQLTPVIAFPAPDIREAPAYPQLSPAA